MILVWCAAAGASAVVAPAAGARKHHLTHQQHCDKLPANWKKSHQHATQQEKRDEQDKLAMQDSCSVKLRQV